MRYAWKQIATEWGVPAYVLKNHDSSAASRAFFRSPAANAASRRSPIRASLRPIIACAPLAGRMEWIPRPDCGTIDLAVPHATLLPGSPAHECSVASRRTDEAYSASAKTASLGVSQWEKDGMMM